MDIVPELAEAGKSQGLIGNPARSVIDHENKSAGQQQQSNKSEETADHESPYVCVATEVPSALSGTAQEIQPLQGLIYPSGGKCPAGEATEVVDAAGPGLYKD